MDLQTEKTMLIKTGSPELSGHSGRVVRKKALSTMYRMPGSESGGQDRGCFVAGFFAMLRCWTSFAGTGEWLMDLG